MADKTTVKFPCGSTGHPDYCPTECGFGRYCKFLKNQPVKPRGMQQEMPKVAKKAAEQTETPGKVEMYY